MPNDLLTARTTPPRKPREFNYVPPLYVKKLIERYGSAKASDLIGTSPETLNNGVREGSINKPYEVAAKGIWTEKEGAATKDKVAILCAPDKVMEMVQMMVTNIGGKFHVIP